MLTEHIVHRHDRLRLKNPTGWFAAGDPFRRASARLTDGAFRLFVHICLEADRLSGCYAVSQTEFAHRLGKSRRSIGAYVAELTRQGICQVSAGKNQFAQTTFCVDDDYWPYVRTQAEPARTSTPNEEVDSYVGAVRSTFLNLGCTGGIFHHSDEALARDYYERHTPLNVMQDALVLGAVRKLAACLEGRSTGAVATLRYFETVIGEVAAKPLDADYGRYLRNKLERFRAEWSSVQTNSPDLRPELVAQKSNNQTR